MGSIFIGSIFIGSIFIGSISRGLLRPAGHPQTFPVGSFAEGIGRE